MKYKDKKTGRSFDYWVFLSIKVFVFMLFLFTSFFGSHFVYGADGVPKVINFQGRLMNSSGDLLGGPSGTEYCYKFSIYDATTGGSKIWPAGSPLTDTILTREGVFDAYIGDVDTLDLAFTDDQAYVNVEVATKVGATCAPGDGAESFESMSPRPRIASSAFAINSSTVGGFTPAQSGTDNQIPVLTSGELILSHATAAGVTASGSNPLTFQSGSTGDINFFSTSNKITSSGALTIAGLMTSVGVTSSSDYIQSAGTMSLTSANTTQTTTSSAFAGNFNSLTTGTGMYLASSSLTSGSLIDLAVTGTGGLTGQKGLNISLSGANGTGAQTTYGAYVSNTHTGTSNNVGLYATASGGTNNYAAVFDAGNVGIGVTAPRTALEILNISTTTGDLPGSLNSQNYALALYSDNTQINSRPGIIQYAMRSTTSGIAYSMQSAYIGTSEANVQLGGTLGFYGNVNTGGSHTNNYMYFDARTSGAYNVATLKVDSNNRVGIALSSSNRPVSALDVGGGISVGSYAATTAAPSNGLIVSGSVGIGGSSPSSLFSVGSSSQFQVNSSGVIAAAAGITSSGTITFSGLGGGGTLCVQTDTSGVLSAAAAGCNSGANTALSNLSSVAINTSLISDTTNTDDLGSSSILWKDLFVTNIELGHASDLTLSRAGTGILNVEGVRVITSSSIATGTILKNNGTTYVQSTETYAAPGTIGNVMTSDGTNWTSAAPSGGANPAGSGSELQYRVDGSTFGAITNSAVSGEQMSVGGAIVSDYLLTLNGSTSGDRSRVLNIIQSNDSDEDSSAIYVTATPTLGTVGANREIKANYLSFIPSFTVPDGTTVNTIGDDISVNLSNITHSDVTGIYLRSINYGSRVSVTGGPTFNDTSGADSTYFNAYGVYSVVDITPTLTNVTDAYITTTAGSFSNPSASAGAAGLVSNTSYGILVQSSGNLTTTGSTTHYGANISASGTADTNYGLYVSSSGATTNYAAIFASGNVGIGDTTPASLFTVGSGDLFQVNSSGIIAVAAGITSSGTITFSGLGGGGSQCVLTDNSGVLSAGSCGSGANTALSNLASVAINTSLLPGTDDSIDLGDDTHRWRDLYLGGETIHIGTSTTDEGLISYNTSSNIFNFGTDSTSNGDIAFFTDDLYLDKSAGYLGIGTTTPGAKFHVSDGNSVAASLLTSDYIVLSAVETAPGLSIISADNDSAGSRAVFKGVRSRGTLSTPLVPSNSDDVLSFLGAIYDGVDTEATAMIGFVVDGTVSSNVAPQKIGFYTSATNGAGRTERLTIKSSGSVGIGDTTPDSLFTVGTTSQFQVNSSGAIVASTGYIQSSGTFSLTSANTTQTTTSSAFAGNFNSLTSGTGMYLASSSLTSGKLVDLQVSGTAAQASQTVLNILTAGATSTSGITTYGAQISNTHTNATSGTNVALYLNASGATTANYGLIVNAGNVGIGITTPTSILSTSGTSGVAVNLTTNANNTNFFSGSYGGTDQFKVNFGGAGEIRFIIEDTVDNTNGNYFIQKTGESFARSVFGRSFLGFGPGSATRDVFVDRSTTNTLRISSNQGTGAATLLVSGALGIGDTSPSAMFTVGSGGLFRVNSSGIITTAAGITSSGTITFSGLGGGGSQCVLTDNSGVLSAGSCGGGGSTWNGITNPTGDQALTFDAGEETTWTVGATTATNFTMNADSLTSGTILSLSSNGTAALTGQKGLNISLAGDNGTSGQTSYGAYISNTHTGSASENYGLYSTVVGASGGGIYYAVSGNASGGTAGTYYGGRFTSTASAGTNYGIYVSASGGDTDYAAIFASGNVGVGDTTPASLFTVGSGDLFQVNSSGYIASTAGIEFTESDSNPTCSSGNYSIFADTSEAQLKKCVNGVVLDLASPDVNNFVDDTTESVVDADTTDYWDGTYPNITPSSTNAEVLVMATVYITGNGGNDNMISTRVLRHTSAITCQSVGTAVGSLMGTFITDTSPSTSSMTAVFIDTPATTSNIQYTLCSDADTAFTSAIGGTMTRIEFTLLEVNNAADLAEIYPTNDRSLTVGDVVSIDPNLTNGIKRSTGAYDRNVLGIVSTKPALVIGNKGEQGVDGKPVALSGRVPVNVNKENGPIKKGDVLTASSTPGVAMKMTKSGAMLAIALEDYNGEGKGSIMSFVKSGYYNGSNLKEILESNNTENIEITQENIGKVALGYLVNKKANQTAVLRDIDVSEILTDRLVSGLEIITPTVLTEKLETEKILLKVNGVESLELTAKSLNAILDDIEEIKLAKQIQDEDIVNLKQKDIDFSAKVTEIETMLSKGIFVDENNIVTMNSIKVSGVAEFSGQTTFSGENTFNGLTFFNQTVTFAQSVNFSSATEFSLPPIFNKDTAGFALIKEGDRRVEVVFEQPYATTPVVNTDMTFETEDNIDDVSADFIFSSDVRFITVNKNINGFTILLNKNAPRNIRFSWIAFGVRDAKVFESLVEGLQISIVTITETTLTENINPESTNTETEEVLVENESESELEIIDQSNEETEVLENTETQDTLVEEVTDTILVEEVTENTEDAVIPIPEIEEPNTTDTTSTPESEATEEVSVI